GTRQEVTDNSETYTAMLEIDHKPLIIIDATVNELIPAAQISVEGMKFASVYPVQYICGNNNGTTTLVTLRFTEKTQAADYYALTMRVGDEELHAHIVFGGPVYWYVSNLKEWNSLIASGHGTTSENVRVTGPVDFKDTTSTGDPTADGKPKYTGLLFSHLEGWNLTSKTVPTLAELEDGGHTGFRNLDYTADAAGTPWISSVVNGVQGLKFYDIDSNFREASYDSDPGTGTGIIAQVGSVSDCMIEGTDLLVRYRYRKGGFFGAVSGDISDVKLQNCTLTSNLVLGADDVGMLAGIVSGTLSDITAEHITVELEGGNDRVGGLVGNTSGVISDIRANDVKVLGPRSNIGGVVGNATGAITNVTVTDSTVTGSSNYVGGVVGYTNAAIANITLTNCTVTGSERVGGVVGNYASKSITNATVTNCTVTGSGNNVGGIGGYMTGGYDSKGVVVDGCVISGNTSVGGVIGGNHAFGVENLRVTGCVISGVSNVGGIQGNKGDGNGPMKHFVVRDTTISGTKGVGGATGGGCSNLANGYIAEDVTVTASDVYAGGIVGDAYSYITVTNIACGATVTSEHGYAGGIAGIIRYYTNSQQFTSCYYHGSVNGGSGIAAGVTGDWTVASGGSKQISKIAVAANLSGGSTIATLKKDSLGTVSYIYVWEGGTGANLTGDETWATLEGAEWFRTGDNYTSSLGFAASNWDVSDLSTYMPYLMYNGSILPYVASWEGYNKATVDAQGNITRTAIEAGSGGIRVPGGALGMMMMARRAVTYTYASGVDTVNTETGGSVTTRAIDPAADSEYFRTVMTWGGYWYYINGASLVYGDGTGRLGTVEGVESPVHLWQGEALDSAGNVYALNGGTASPASALSEGEREPKPFYAWGAAEVYYTYSVVDGVTLPYRVLPNGATFTATQGAQYDGAVWYADESGSWFGYLDGEGYFTTAGETPVPSGWASSGIRHMSNSFGGETPIVVLRYDDGTASVVNLTTGETIDSGSGNFLSYALHSLKTTLNGFTASALRSDSSFADSLALSAEASGERAQAHPEGEVSRGGETPASEGTDAERVSGEGAEGETGTPGTIGEAGEGGEAAAEGVSALPEGGALEDGTADLDGASD
ncbi:MAG: right-handed parallel beta-helix repeat-containing protein, partial [Oscillospiraceae bacterium]|nr:right-handed parallel beta-helix repeat-containing protein [Oscillospiraceae bacterium]